MLTEEQWAAIRPAIVRLRAATSAIALGVTFGLGLFVATAWLVIRGGPTVGRHLGLLGQYFPGYVVTWRGAFIGLLWGLFTGGIIGYAIAFLYNTVAVRRQGRRPR